MNKSKGHLCLIPTPLYEHGPLDSRALEILKNACLAENLSRTVVLVEEAKVARTRWLRWGLPREIIDCFILYNEHTVEQKNKEILNLLMNGKNVYLLSDGGAPVFCDPGVELVDLCHQNKISIKSVGLDSSLMLSLILCGYKINPMIFLGFLPRQEKEREESLRSMAPKKELIVVMDTPYRLQALLGSVMKVMPQREIFLAMDLGHPDEELFRGTASEALACLAKTKREFVLIFSPLRMKK